MNRRKRVPLIVGTVVVTFLVAIAVLNLSLGNKQIDSPLMHLYKVADAQFARTMGSVLSPTLIPGNRVSELLNGEQIFPAMLQVIRSAGQSITFETYIYWSGSVGQDFIDALIERAASGVQVHLLLDWIGGGLDDVQLARMRDSGVEVRRYNSPRWYNLDRLNNRTHRKLLIVDGKVGFIGGVGIADVWRGHAQDPMHWRDTHFRVVEGPVMAQMQSAFIDNWIQATGSVLRGEAYLPELDPIASMTAQAFTSSPGGGAESMQLMYLLSITAAAESIRISASYFVPDDVAIDSLVTALERGVRVRPDHRVGPSTR